MSEILHATQQNKYLILNKEKQLCGYTLHQELLTNYKRNRRYPKGFRLKFNLSLCSDSPELKRNCNNVLRNASLKLRDIILKSVELKVKEINKERDSLRNKIKAKVRATEFRNIQNYVLRKIENLSLEIKYRHEKKYKRANISAIESNRQNRRFRRGKRKKHNKQRKKRWAEQQQILINEAKQNCPDQNAINLCNLEISDSADLLLSKGPSYVPSPKDIDWYKLKQDFDSFVNKLRKHYYQSQFITTKDKNEEHLEQSVDRNELHRNA